MRIVIESWSLFGDGVAIVYRYNRDSLHSVPPYWNLLIGEMLKVMSRGGLQCNLR